MFVKRATVSRGGTLFPYKFRKFSLQTVPDHHGDDYPKSVTFLLEAGLAETR